MRVSIVWRCALTIAVSQIVVFIIVSTLLLASGLAPLYREWSASAVETLQAHHEHLSKIAARDGYQAAVAVAKQLSTAHLNHQIIEKNRWEDSAEYMDVVRDQWLAWGQSQQELKPHDGWFRWITFPSATEDDASTASQVVIISSHLALSPNLLSRQPTGAALWIGGCLLLAALVGGLVATWFTRPILKLRRTVMQFAAGHLDTRPDEDLQARRDELGDLSRDLSTMKNRIASLVNAHRQLLDDVAHELRSPLARMNVSLELLERTRHDSQSETNNDSAQFIARIQRDCAQLANMTDRLLQLSALEHQTDGDERNELNLTQLARDIAEDCNFEAQSVDRAVILQVENAFFVLGNTDMLRAAIENTIRNAIRYTPSGSAVDVTVTSVPDQPDRARIIVRDYGRGVPDASLSKLFMPFYRVESDRNQASGGAGLGLALADRAIRAHAGSMAARNHPDGGLELTMELPTIVRLNNRVGVEKN